MALATTLYKKSSKQCSKANYEYLKYLNLNFFRRSCLAILSKNLQEICSKQKFLSNCVLTLFQVILLFNIFQDLQAVGLKQSNEGFIINTGIKIISDSLTLQYCPRISNRLVLHWQKMELSIQLSSFRWLLKMFSKKFCSLCNCTIIYTSSRFVFSEHRILNLPMLN